jgi:ureidoacrylate peracid hydrolase
MLASRSLAFDVSERIGGKNMENLKFDKEITALLLIDPYNDFISEGGKLWDRLKTVAEANDCVPHML